MAPILDRLALAAGAAAAGLTLAPAFESRPAVAVTVVASAILVVAFLPSGWPALPAVFLGPASAVLLAGQPVPVGALTGPTGWERLGGTLLHGPSQALRLTLPLPAELAIVPALLTGVAAAGGSVLLRRRPGSLVALIPSTLVGAYGLVVAGNDASQTVPAGLGVAAVGAFLVLDRWRIGGRSTAAVATVLVVATPVLGMSLPGTSSLADPFPGMVSGRPDPRDHFRGTARVAASVDVLDLVGGWLSAPAGEVLFTADAAPAPRWRLAVLDEYDGRTWRSSGRPVPAGLGVPPYRGAVPTGAITRTVEVVALRGPYLPAVDRPIRIGPPVDALDPGTGVLFTSQPLSTGTRYQVTSAPGPVGADVSSVSAETVPDDLRPAIRVFLAGVSRPAGTPAAEQAEAVVAALRRGRRNVTGSPAGAAASAVESLLRPGGTGTTVQFAATFALVMRALGVPARLVVGFGGGTTVHSRDVHVWTELRRPGAGWVTYDPTPAPVDADPSAPRLSDPPPVDATSVLPDPDGLRPPPAPLSARVSSWPRIALALLAAVLVALLFRILAPVARRAWRRFRPAEPDVRVADAWRDVLDAWTPPPGTSRAAVTPRLLHERLAGLLAENESDGRVLSRLADRALYSSRPCTPEDGREAWRSARRVRRAMRRHRRASVSRSVRATGSPQVRR